MFLLNYEFHGKVGETNLNNVKWLCQNLEQKNAGWGCLHINFHNEFAFTNKNLPYVCGISSRGFLAEEESNHHLSDEIYLR